MAKRNFYQIPPHQHTMQKSKNSGGDICSMLRGKPSSEWRWHDRAPRSTRDSLKGEYDT